VGRDEDGRGGWEWACARLAGVGMAAVGEGETRGRRSGTRLTIPSASLSRSAPVHRFGWCCLSINSIASVQSPSSSESPPRSFNNPFRNFIHPLPRPTVNSGGWVPNGTRRHDPVIPRLFEQLSKLLRMRFRVEYLRVWSSGCRSSRSRSDFQSSESMLDSSILFVWSPT